MLFLFGIHNKKRVQEICTLDKEISTIPVCHLDSSQPNRRTQVTLTLILLLSSLILTGAHTVWAKVEGVFMIVKGEVKVISPDQKSEFARVGMKVSEGYSVITGVDGRAKIVMSDKNILNLNSESQLRIETYKNEGGLKKVELSLSEGSVRAMVNQKYDDNKNTFRVKTPTAVAGVRGTDFLVKFDVKTQLSSVKTFEGLVAVGNPADVLKGGSRAAALALVAAGQQVELDGRSNQRPEPQPIPQQELQELKKETDAEKADGNKTAEQEQPRKEEALGRKEQAAERKDQVQEQKQQAQEQRERASERKEQAQERREQLQERKEQRQEAKQPARQELRGSTNPPNSEVNESANPPPRPDVPVVKSDLIKNEDLKIDNMKNGVQESLPASRMPAQIAPHPNQPIGASTPLPSSPVTNNPVGETIRNQVGGSSKRIQIGIIKNENPVPNPGTVTGP